MEHEVAWKKYDEVDLEALEGLASNYIDFISENKTERRCAATAIRMAEKAGYVSLADAVREGRALSAGDKVWAHSHGKALILVQLGSNPLSKGMNRTRSTRATASRFSTRTTTAVSRTTNGLRSRSPCTASSPRRTARSWT